MVTVHCCVNSDESTAEWETAEHCSSTTRSAGDQFHLSAVRHQTRPRQRHPAPIATRRLSLQGQPVGRLLCAVKKYPYIRRCFVASFPHFNVGPGFYIPSIYGYSRMRNRFRWNMENSPQNICVVIRIFLQCTFTRLLFNGVGSVIVPCVRAENKTRQVTLFYKNEHLKNVTKR